MNTKPTVIIVQDSDIDGYTAQNLHFIHFDKITNVLLEQQINGIKKCTINLVGSHSILLTTKDDIDDFVDQYFPLLNMIQGYTYEDQIIDQEGE